MMILLVFYLLTNKGEEISGKIQRALRSLTRLEVILTIVSQCMEQLTPVDSISCEIKPCISNVSAIRPFVEIKTKPGTVVFAL